MRYHLPALPVLTFALFALAGALTARPAKSPDVLAVLPGHADTVEAVAISPDGTLVATGSFDAKVRLFDLTTAKEVRTFGGEQGHKGQVLCVAFSPKGDQLATGGADNTLRIWDVPVNVPAKTFSTPAAATRVVVAPDGKTFAVAGADGVVKVFPQGEEKGAIELKGHKGPVTHVASAGPGWVTAGADKTIRAWAADGKQTAARSVGAGITGLATAPNGQTVWTALGDGRVQAWAIPLPKAIPTAAPGTASGIALAALEAAAAKGSPVPGVPAREWAIGGKAAGVVVSPDGARIITVGPGKECVSWTAGDGKKERGFETGGEATAAAVSKDGQRVAVAGADGSVKLYTTGDGKLVGSVAAGGAVNALAFHPAAPQLVGTLQNAATVWNVAAPPGPPAPPEFGKVVQTFPHPRAVTSPAFNADNQFFTAGEDKQVRRFRIAAGVPVKNLAHPNLVDCAAFDGTGNLLATGCHDGILRIWDPSKNTPVKTINAHVVTTPQQVQNPIYAVAWSPDHKQVFTSSYDKTIKSWDVASGNPVREFKADPGPKPIAVKKDEPKKDEKKEEKKEEPKKDEPKKEEAKKEEPKKDEPPGPPGHRDQVFSIALSRDGKLLASASSDRTVKLWDVATGRVVRDFANPDFKPVFPTEPAPSHPGWVQSVRFTPDGKYLVTAGPAPKGKSYLAVWDVTDGKRVYGAERDQGPIHSLAVTNDGTRLVLGCAAGKGKADAGAIVVKLPGK